MLSLLQGGERSLHNNVELYRYKLLLHRFVQRSRCLTLCRWVGSLALVDILFYSMWLQ